MSVERARFVILGAGITGLTAAFALSKRFPSEVVVLEKAAAVGGLASTSTREKWSFDYGSHRLHNDNDPAVESLLRELCGEDLLRRPRRGRIYLGAHALPYPPSAVDIVTAFGANDLFRFSRDFLVARVGQWVTRSEPADFEAFVISKVGRSLYERFYKPYALKLYGISPRELSRDPAIHRVRKFSFGQICRDVRKKLLQQTSYYYYPRHGIGQLADTLRQRLVCGGGRVYSAVETYPLPVQEGRKISHISFRTDSGAEHTIETDYVVSTIPLNALYRAVAWDTNDTDSFDLRWRGLRLLYLITRAKIAGESETWYFPESDVPFGRVSALHRYSAALNNDSDKTLLTIEIPCSEGDLVWSATDEDLSRVCLAALVRLGIIQGPHEERPECFSVRLRGVYPIYELGWKERFERVYNRLDGIGNLYMAGRSALFLHCNIDHCMLMALKVADHLVSGGSKTEAWQSVQQKFLLYRVRE